MFLEILAAVRAAALAGYNTPEEAALEALIVSLGGVGSCPGGAGAKAKVAGILAVGRGAGRYRSPSGGSMLSPSCYHEDSREFSRRSRRVAREIEFAITHN